MGSDPTGGASLGGNSPSGGASLGADTQAKNALREKLNAQSANEPPIKKPSEVTGDPYDDHPGTVYACEGPVSKDTSGKGLGVVGGLTGTALSEFGGNTPVPVGGPTFVPRSPAPSKSEMGGVTSAGAAAGYMIGSTKWFNCYVNNGYNFIFHPGATQTIDQDGDSGGLERE